MEHAIHLLRLSVDMLCVAGTDGYFKELNPAFERVLGHPLAELKERPFLEFVHPDDRTATLAEVEKLKTGAITLRFENRYRCRNGTYRWLQWTCHPDASRGLLFAVARDITEAKDAEDRLRRAEDALREAHQDLWVRYKAVIQASRQLIYERDPRTGEVSFSNAELALGYGDEELAGGLAQWLELIHPEDRHRIADALRRDEGHEIGLEYRVRRRDGTYIDVVDRGYAVDDESTSGRRVIGFVVDVSSRKRLEEQLRQAIKMEAIGRLAGGVAHDFNNLLTAIMGYSQLMAARLGPHDPALRDTEEILRAAERASMLTRQLLAFSRREVLQPQTLDLNAIVSDMGRMLRRLIGATIDLVVVPGPGLGMVKADAGHLEQVIMNLAVNARDAMPEGGTLTIETSNVEIGEAYSGGNVGLEPGSYVLLAVSDTGTGMDPETQARIFEPFFTTKDADRGTGLGLSTVYGIVRQWRGAIHVYSDPGWGTTFKVYLPRAAGKARANRPAAGLDNAPRGTETVLVVEDQDAVAVVIRGTLQLCGYEVLEARHGADALAILERHEGPVHLLLTDVVMPVMGGPELAQRAWLARPDLKVLYVSGYTERAFASHAELDPRAGFLQKPFMPEALARKVREILDARPHVPA